MAGHKGPEGHTDQAGSQVLLLLLLCLLLPRAEAGCLVSSLEARTSLEGDTVLSATVKSFYMKVPTEGRGGRVQSIPRVPGDHSLARY